MGKECLWSLELSKYFRENAWFTRDVSEANCLPQGLYPLLKLWPRTFFFKLKKWR